MMTTRDSLNFHQLVLDIKHWACELGFQHCGVADTDLSQASERFKQWLAKGFHGSMSYLERNQQLRAAPSALVPGTVRILSVRLDYLPENPKLQHTLKNKQKAYVSRYALGRDYHKVIRKRLNKLAERISRQVGKFGYRAFADSAPVLERDLAVKAGIGWMGKNTMVLSRNAGSWYFLGELYTNLPLPVDSPVSNHCGTCTACLDICPTRAFEAPYVLNATRCISYLTIENKGPIPLELRPLIGNRIFGCDDCQIVCPWNRFAKVSTEPDFAPRHQLKTANLVDLFAWTEEEFLKKTEGSAIRRTGYIGWLRNIAVALGNAPKTSQVIDGLRFRQHFPNEMVQEHVAWALTQTD